MVKPGKIISSFMEIPFSASVYHISRKIEIKRNEKSTCAGAFLNKMIIWKREESWWLHQPEYYEKNLISSITSDVYLFMTIWYPVKMKKSWLLCKRILKEFWTNYERNSSLMEVRFEFYKEELKVHSGKRKGKVHGMKKRCAKMKK